MCVNTYICKYAYIYIKATGKCSISCYKSLFQPSLPITPDAEDLIEYSSGCGCCLVVMALWGWISLQIPGLRSCQESTTSSDLTVKQGDIYQ